MSTKVRSVLKNSGIAFGILGIATAFCFLVQRISESDTHVPLLFVLAVLFVSRFTDGYVYGIVASIIAVFGVNYVFTFPYFKLNFAITGYPLTFVAMLAVACRYFVKGSVDQVVAIAGYLEVMAIVGAAAFGAGVVLTVMRRKWTRFAAAGKWLLGLGLFFGVSSLLMRRVYPMGTTVMCILVPVLMLLAVVFLLYQHEFAVQAIALTLAIASAVLLNHGSSSMPALVTAFCWAAMVFVAALLVLTVMLQKHEGSYKGTVIFPAKTNYALTCAVLVLSIAAIAVSLFAGLAYYVIWGAAVLLFVLAVWYTVKML